MILLVIFSQRLGEKSLESFCTSIIPCLVFCEYRSSDDALKSYLEFTLLHVIEKLGMFT